MHTPATRGSSSSSTSLFIMITSRQVARSLTHLDADLLAGLQHGGVGRHVHLDIVHEDAREVALSWSSSSSSSSSMGSGVGSISPSVNHHHCHRPRRQASQTQTQSTHAPWLHAPLWQQPANDESFPLTQSPASPLDQKRPVRQPPPRSPQRALCVEMIR